MKIGTYISGFVFLALLLVFTYLKWENRAMPEWVLYLFSASAFVFFFLLIFTALRGRRDQ